MNESTIQAAAEEVRAAGDSAPRAGRDPVNLPMIRSWQEALGDTDPRYVAEGVAPPAMIQVWTMPGLHGVRASDDPLGRMTAVLDEAGFTSVVATNCEQTYHREVRVGEALTVSARLDEVVGPKRTALGEGWFVTTVNTWFAGGEPVAEMRFRILKFRPPAAEPAPAAPGSVVRPVFSRDTEFFWSGVHQRELRLQRCEACGQVRHPPGPVCIACGAEKPGYVVAAGTGTVHSYVVHHHPPTPGRTPPYVVVLVDLTEGVRMLGELVGVDPLDPGAVSVGMPVELTWQDGGDGVVLPAWKVAS
ncbi:bifunctional MaoC family dehydratase N-terminal/OB-fold nucleic acid binding domain-containing protein [Spongisporangium articulatum]|uniref:Bifunctional MaoC family dehydratase N-terminal/OB-fold nucleic acid binding domain-containing protein n=1 Tax=Spongisporangium articulatum TaxID=3362603 RepID=A0ABW8AV65_9ACTN